MKFAVMMALLLCVFVTQLSAEIVGKVTEFGYYKALEDIDRTRNNASPSGYVRSGGNVKLTRQTIEIPIDKDRLFGFKFRLEGFDPDLRSASLILEVTHPEMTRPNGSKTKGYSYPVNIDVWQGISENRSGYRFDKDYEMVEGEWVFQYLYKNKMIVQQKFNLFKPAADSGQPQAPEMTQSVSSEEFKLEDSKMPKK